MPNFKITPRAMADLRNIGRYTFEKWGKEQRDIYLRNPDKRFHMVGR
jgi:toxin ParE1/3/4